MVRRTLNSDLALQGRLLFPSSSLFVALHYETINGLYVYLHLVSISLLSFLARRLLFFHDKRGLTDGDAH